MKISTKGRYGVRIMLELAMHYDEDLLTVRRIAEKQEISEKYIEQIIGTLHKADLVRSQRGAAGGYCLAEPPHDITVGRILRVTEGELCVVQCTGDHTNNCTRKDDCVTSDVWLEIREAINSVIDNISLADLVERRGRKCERRYANT